MVRMLALLSLVIAAATTGCSPSDGRLPVNGVVICDGEPLPGANVAFVGGGGGAFATASTDSEGKFSLRAVPGINKISVSALDTANADQWADIPEEEQMMGDEKAVAEAMENMPKPLVAQKYFNASTSGLEVDVKEGMDEAKLEVTAKE